MQRATVGREVAVQMIGVAARALEPDGGMRDTVVTLQQLVQRDADLLAVAQGTVLADEDMGGQ